MKEIFSHTKIFKNTRILIDQYNILMSSPIKIKIKFNEYIYNNQ